MAGRDDGLFEAWQSGDRDARQRLWTLLWQRLYTMAFRFCRGFCSSDAAAEDCASEAFLRTLQELDGKAGRGELRWDSEPAFVSLVRGILLHRCRDRLRRLHRQVSRERSLEEDSGGEAGGRSLLDSLISDAPAPGAAVLRQAGLQAALELLGAARASCGKAADLAATIACIEAYVGTRLADLEEVELTQEQLYDHLERTLGIRRDALFKRMERIRARLRALQAQQEPGPGPAPLKGEETRRAQTQ